jgi:hypothetical protein
MVPVYALHMSVCVYGPPYQMRFMAISIQVRERAGRRSWTTERAHHEWASLLALWDMLGEAMRVCSAKIMRKELGFPIGDTQWSIAKKMCSAHTVDKSTRMKDESERFERSTIK